MSRSRDGMSSTSDGCYASFVDLHQAVLVPDQHHDEEIENSHDNEAEGVRLGVTVQLVADESPEGEHRSRIRPRPVFEWGPVAVTGGEIERG